MEIRIDFHTLKRAEERGTNEDEIKETITKGFEIPAKSGRRGRAGIYQYEQKRLDKVYEQKRVEVIYIQEGNVIVTVTVYVFMENGRSKHEHSV